jgi:hypothetical protein
VLYWFGAADSPDEMICEVYFSFFVELQANIFTQSWMNTRIIREFRLIHRISESSNATSNQYSSINRVQLTVIVLIRIRKEFVI